MMERHLDEELRELNTLILRMGALAEEAVYLSIEALKKKDTSLAEKIIKDDKKIDLLEIEVEEKALEILATGQPWAIDLRFVTTGMRINSELERIADLAVNIARRVVEMGDAPLLKPLIDVPKMTEIARKMVHNAIESFLERDEKLAEDVILFDSEADKLRDLIQNELVYDYMEKDGATAPRAVPLLLVSRHLERVCDHATNIAEDVIFMVRAKTVKHKRLKKEKDKILFVCVHNSARSQMAEAFLKEEAGDKFEVTSAGLEAGELNPIAVKVMKEAGIDISGNKTTGVKELLEAKERFGYVITVCDSAHSEKCPVFPGAKHYLNWEFDDPSGFSGTEEEKLEATRKIRDEIRLKILSWLKEM